VHGSSPWASYDDYLADMQAVWRQCARVLRPNGKLCINAPIMPVPRKLIPQNTRHINQRYADLAQECVRAVSPSIALTTTSAADRSIMRAR
jgi:DNA modification methylase